MDHVVATRLSLEEKSLVQALAARRGLHVSHLIRAVLLDEVRKVFRDRLVDEKDVNAEYGSKAAPASDTALNRAQPPREEDE